MTALAERPPTMSLAHMTDYTREQIDLIKATVAAGTSDLEFQMFMEVARTMGLSPLQKQIHAVMRWDNQEKRQKMVIQTGIDGYRLIAARTGAHLGTTDAVYGPLTKDGYPEWAQVTTKRLVHGQVAEFPATAFWDEYVQKVKDGSPNSMWRGRPRGQLGKCAEALALRKAFPAELSGVYSDIEMQQADSEAPAQQQARTVDVTREVAQAAGVEPQQPARAPALLAWEEKIGKAGARLTELGLRDQAVMVMRQHPHWKTDVADASAVYTAMKQIGERHAEDLVARTAQEGELPSQVAQALDIDEPVQAEAMISPERLKALQTAYHSKLGLKTPGDRHDFACWFLTLPEPLASTKDLTEDQATTLMDTIGSWDDEGVSDSLARFRMWQEARLPF